MTDFGAHDAIDLVENCCQAENVLIGLDSNQFAFPQISGLVKKKCDKTTIRVRGVRIADDLLVRDFTATEPNTK